MKGWVKLETSLGIHTAACSSMVETGSTRLSDEAGSHCQRIPAQRLICQLDFVT